MTEVSVRVTPTWTVQINDVIGGWVVTTYPHPLSEHHFGDPDRRGFVAAECVNRSYANLIARLLNGLTCCVPAHGGTGNDD